MVIGSSPIRSTCGLVAQLAEHYVSCTDWFSDHLFPVLCLRSSTAEQRLVRAKVAGSTPVASALSLRGWQESVTGLWTRPALARCANTGDHESGLQKGCDAHGTLATQAVEGLRHVQAAQVQGPRPARAGAVAGTALPREASPDHPARYG